MKKLLLLFISLILSFNSYAEWTEIPVIEDGSAEKAFIDFDNLKRKSDDYVYWWMMTSRFDSSEKIYLRTDCEGERMNSLQVNFHNQTLGQGESSSIQSDEGWTYPAPDTAMYRFLGVVCEMADENSEQRAQSVQNLLMSIEYKNKINYLYEKDEEVQKYEYLIEEERQKLDELEAERTAQQLVFETEQFNRLMTQNSQAEEDKKRQMMIEDQLNILRAAYVNNIAARVKSFWRYLSAEDDWSCEVYVRQDRSGNLQDVEIRNCKTNYSSNSQTFKDSVMRAVYKSAPLPSAPHEAVFESEILFTFNVN